MADVVIEHLQITVELDGAGADEHFHRMFDTCIERWAAVERARAADRKFAEHERMLPQHEGFR
jgi:hypothetical protein